MESKQYTLADARGLLEAAEELFFEQPPYEDDAFAELCPMASPDQVKILNTAAPIIRALLDVVQKQHEALETFVERCGYNGDYPLATEPAREVLALTSPWIEQKTA
jgi:hypothetical protein